HRRPRRRTRRHTRHPRGPHDRRRVRRVRRRPGPPGGRGRRLRRAGGRRRRRGGDVILHLMPVAAWEAWRDDRRGYEPPSLATEGFVHCTGDDDLMLVVATRFYAGEAGDLVVVTLDEARLTSEVRWEAPAHADGSAPSGGEPVFPP